MQFTHAMRVDGQHLGWEVTTGPTDFSKRCLELLSLVDRAGLEEIMDGAISGQEGQAVGQFKAFLGERSPPAAAASTEHGLMDQLRGQARIDLVGVGPGPSREQIPGAQAKVLGDKHPNPELIAGDFIGQKLPDLPLQALASACSRRDFRLVRWV